MECRTMETTPIYQKHYIRLMPSGKKIQPHCDRIYIDKKGSRVLYDEQNMDK